MPRVVASIEARMASSRLPGKVLADICGAPALTRLVRRLRQSRSIDDIVLATTVNASDDVLVDWARKEGVQYHRGSEDDVLGRVTEAHEKLGSDIVVEICGDTPLLDPAILDLAVAVSLANDAAVVSTVRVASFPQGIDAEVFPMSALRSVAARIVDPAVREHVSLYFYEHPEEFRIIHLAAPNKWQRPTQRLQLDYPEDLQLINELYRRLEPSCGDRFGIDEILALLDTVPSLAAINSHCEERPAR